MRRTMTATLRQPPLYFEITAKLKNPHLYLTFFVYGGKVPNWILDILSNPFKKSLPSLPFAVVTETPPSPEN
jgi:hypothetical protein